MYSKLHPRRTDRRKAMCIRRTAASVACSYGSKWTDYVRVEAAIMLGVSRTRRSITACVQHRDGVIDSAAKNSRMIVERRSLPRTICRRR